MAIPGPASLQPALSETSQYEPNKRCVLFTISCRIPGFVGFHHVARRIVCIPRAGRLYIKLPAAGRRIFFLIAGAYLPLTKTRRPLTHLNLNNKPKHNELPQGSHHWRHRCTRPRDYQGPVGIPHKIRKFWLFPGVRRHQSTRRLTTQRTHFPFASPGHQHNQPQSQRG